MNWLLAAIVIGLPSYLVRFGVAGIPTTLLELIIYAATVVGVAAYIREPTVRERLRSRIHWLLPAVLLLVGGVVGVAASSDLRLSLGIFKGYIADPILVYLLLVGWLRDTADASRVVRWLVIGVMGVAIHGAVRAVSLYEDRALGIYALDPASSPNYLAFALAPVVPLILVAVKQPWQRLLAIGLFMATLAMTGSRAGVVAAGAGLLLAVTLMSPLFQSKRWVRLAVMVMVVIGLAGSWLVVRPDFGASSATGGRTTSSNNIRWQIWGATSELVRAHPVTGLGLGNYQAAFNELTADRVNFAAYITPEARTPHNVAIGLWTELGIAGLSAWFVALVLAGTSLVRGLRRTKTQQLAAALIGSWFVLLAHGLVDVPIWKNDLMVVFWLLVACSLALGRSAKASK